MSNRWEEHKCDRCGHLFAKGKHDTYKCPKCPPPKPAPTGGR